jgi:hypothetical protein
MNAMLVIKTKNGYAVAPYTGGIPADFMTDMEVATRLSHSYDKDTVIQALERHFEPKEPTQLKEVA